MDSSTDSSTDHLKYIEGLRDIHAGEDIWVIGAGASMDDYPIDFFADKICIGMNNVYSAFIDIGDGIEKLQSRIFYSVHEHKQWPKVIIETVPHLLKNCFFLSSPKRRPGMVWWEDFKDYNDVIHYMQWGIKGVMGVCATVEDFEVMVDCMMTKEGGCHYVMDGTTLHWAISAAVVLGAKKVYVAGAEAVGGHMQKHGSLYAISHPPARPDTDRPCWREGTKTLTRLLKPHGVDIVFYYHGVGEVDPLTVSDDSAWDYIGRESGGRMSGRDDVIVAIDWGDVGGTIHSLIALQKLSLKYGRKVCFFTGDRSARVNTLTDHIPWAEHYLAESWGPGAIASWRDEVLESISDDTGRNTFKLVNMSHHLPSPSKLWMVTDWWSRGFHCMDFSAECAGVDPLVGKERKLFINDLPEPSVDHILLLPNCSDPAQRGWPSDHWEELVGQIRDKYGDVVIITTGEGDILPTRTKDCRNYSLWEVVCAMRQARIIISIDTMASASLAESVGTPIIRIHRGGRTAANTGPGIQGWGGHVWCSDAGYNQAATVDTVMVGVEMLWDMKENWEANHIIK